MAKKHIQQQKSNKPNPQLRLALPKGSLQESTFQLMKKAGFKVRASHRAYVPEIDDPEIEIRLIRAQEIPRYVDSGDMDAGITGWDWIKEARAKVKEIGELVYAKSGLGRIKWVLAVPEESPYKSVKDLQGKRIATEVVQITRAYLRKQKIKAEVEFSWGATEVKAPELCDAIVELTETGRSLRANRLRIIDAVLESTTRLIMHPKTYQNAWKREKVENLYLLLQSALEAETKVGMKMNVPKRKVKSITALLPALRNPTISPLYNSAFMALEIVVEEKKLRTLIPQLKKLGAEGIIVYPLTKIIY